MNAAATATPPPRGIGTTVDPAMVRLVDRVDAERDPPDERREENEISAAATKAAIRYGTAAQASAVNLTRPASADARLGGRGPGPGSGRRSRRRGPRAGSRPPARRAARSRR